LEFHYENTERLFFLNIIRGAQFVFELVFAHFVVQNKNRRHNLINKTTRRFASGTDRDT